MQKCRRRSRRAFPALPGYGRSEEALWTRAVNFHGQLPDSRSGIRSPVCFPDFLSTESGGRPFVGAVIAALPGARRDFASTPMLSRRRSGTSKYILRVFGISVPTTSPNPELTGRSVLHVESRKRTDFTIMAPRLQEVPPSVGAETWDGNSLRSAVIYPTPVPLLTAPSFIWSWSSPPLSEPGAGFNGGRVQPKRT